MWLIRCLVLQDIEDGKKNSMLVVSEFVGCSPSLSGAIRVNPWSIDNVADAIYSAIKLDPKQRHDRHAKHWRYVSHHTVTYWAQVRGQPFNLLFCAKNSQRVSVCAAS